LQLTAHLPRDEKLFDSPAGGNCAKPTSTLIWSTLDLDDVAAPVATLNDCYVPKPAGSP